MNKNSRQEFARRAQEEFQKIGGEIHSLEQALDVAGKVLGDDPGPSDVMGIANTVFRTYMVTLMRDNGLVMLSRHFGQDRTSCAEIRSFLEDEMRRHPGNPLSLQAKAAIDAFEPKAIKRLFCPPKEKHVAAQETRLERRGTLPQQGIRQH